jgi:hypothetical protein
VRQTDSFSQKDTRKIRPFGLPAEKVNPSPGLEGLSNKHNRIAGYMVNPLCLGMNCCSNLYAKKEIRRQNIRKTNSCIKYPVDAGGAVAKSWAYRQL